MELGTDRLIDMGAPVAAPSIIKIIGVGGGGGNAANHMYNKKDTPVNFLVCNTDQKALNASPIPHRLQLGKDGLGAGNNPAKGRQLAEESVEAIKQKLDDGTKMVFITATMGGGTGTGAAPVIAREAKAKDILTVGIVTIPFLWEGNNKIIQALDGVEELAKNVDSLLVINNQRLIELYGELPVDDAFDKADDTLYMAAHSIVEIIEMQGRINLDFNDVKNFLTNGGVAIMSAGYGEGTNRVTHAIEEALHSPLLNNTDISHSKKIILLITESDKDPMLAEEMQEINAFMSGFGDKVDTKLGLCKGTDMDKKVKITLLATGFGTHDIRQVEEHIMDKESKEEEEKKARIATFYGKDIKGRQMRVVRSHIFDLDDLDNEEVISLVEVKPTLQRNKEDLAEIESKTAHSKPADIDAETLTNGGYVIEGF